MKPLLPVFPSVMLLALALTSGCGNSSAPLIQRVTPQNGRALVSRDVQPELVLASAATVDLLPPEARKLVLYNVTLGNRVPIAGKVAVEGTTLTYLPDVELLPENSDFVLELAASALRDGAAEALDGSEAPVEPVVWPYRLAFSTRAQLRVRSAYLSDAERAPVLVINFSTDLLLGALEGGIEVLDLAGTKLPRRPIQLLAESTVRVLLDAPLDRAALYTLQITDRLRAKIGLELDGDEDGREGGTYSVKFTGSQPVIRSRQPEAPAATQ